MVPGGGNEKGSRGESIFESAGVGNARRLVGSARGETGNRGEAMMFRGEKSVRGREGRGVEKTKRSGPEPRGRGIQTIKSSGKQRERVSIEGGGPGVDTGSTLLKKQRGYRQEGGGRSLGKTSRCRKKSVNRQKRIRVKESI